MKFTETKKEPEFTLKMNLQETINLYRLIHSENVLDMDIYKPFRDALCEFGQNSNNYNHLDWK